MHIYIYDIITSFAFVNPSSKPFHVALLLSFKIMYTFPLFNYMHTQALVCMFLCAEMCLYERESFLKDYQSKKKAIKPVSLFLFLCVNICVCNHKLKLERHFFTKNTLIIKFQIIFLKHFTVLIIYISSSWQNGHGL